MTHDDLHEWLCEDEENRRLMVEESFLLDVTEKIWDALTNRGVTKADLSRELGTSKSHVTQLLNGSRNMTLRTLADIAFALDTRISIYFRDCHNNNEWHNANATFLTWRNRVPVKDRTTSANIDWENIEDSYEALEA